jgi:hypothetical protein
VITYRETRSRAPRMARSCLIFFMVRFLSGYYSRPIARRIVTLFVYVPIIAESTSCVKALDVIYFLSMQYILA